MSVPLTDQDRAILGNVETSIRQGRELRRWWQANKTSVTRIPFIRQLHNPPEWNYGFLENAVTSAGSLPVAGVIQSQLYSVPGGPGQSGVKPDLDWISRQAQEFMMRHFMRLTSSQNAAIAQSQPKRTTAYTPFSRCGKTNGTREGWGYRQVYYKLAKTGEIGKFPDDKQTSIVDLREVGPVYEWIVFQVTIFGFDITVDLSAGTGPKLQISTEQPVHAVLTPEFVVQQPESGAAKPVDGIVATHGYGYSVVPDLTHPSLIAALPSAIDNTIETLRLDVYEDGTIWAGMDFITPQPPRILNIDPVSLSFRLADLFTFGTASKVLAPVEQALLRAEPKLDPVYTGIDLVNALTANLASENLSIDKRHLFLKLMVLHYVDVVKMYTLSASHFQQVDDWTDEAALPEWAKRGTFTP